MDTYSWYSHLKKPHFAPSSWLFGPVWSVLYLIIFISFGFVFMKIFQKQFPVWLAVPLGLNLIFNFIFTPIQFGLKNNYLAAVDISLVVMTLIWSMGEVYPYSRIFSLSQIPYLLWGLFATLLQYSITWLNRS